MVCAAICFGIKFSKDRKTDTRLTVERALAVMHAMLTHHEGTGLRICIHSVCKHGQETKATRCTAYIYGSSRHIRPSKSTFSVSLGVVGAAYRKRNIASTKLPKDNMLHEEKVRWLIEKWSFVGETASKIIENKKQSWAAFPIFAKSNKESPDIEYILFADSSDRNFFSPAKIIAIAAATPAIAAIVGLDDEFQRKQIEKHLKKTKRETRPKPESKGVKHEKNEITSKDTTPDSGSESQS